MTPGITSADVFRMLGSLALVIALLVAVLWALRKLQGKMNSQSAGRRLQIIESLSVGTRQKVALLRVGEREVLIGISPTQINGIASWPDGSLASADFSDSLDSSHSHHVLDAQAPGGVQHVP
jgi:flagellar protein FliO/FliZ